MDKRTVLITGANGFLGSDLTKKLIADGSQVIGVDVQPLSTAEIDIEVPAFHYFQCDLENENDRSKLAQCIISTVDKLDGVVHCAAFVGTSKLDGWNVPFENFSNETFRRAFEINTLSIIDLVRHLIPALSVETTSSVVFVSSIYGHHPPDWTLYEGTEMNNPIAYGMSKAALSYAVKWLSSVYGHNIRFNEVVPGGISRGQQSKFVERYCNKVHRGRMAIESDISALIYFLLSPESDYVTGASISCDGGFF